MNFIMKLWHDYAKKLYEKYGKKFQEKYDKAKDYKNPELEKDARSLVGKIIDAIKSLVKFD